MDAPHPGSKSANLLSRDGLKEYIMEFQAFGGLNMTGELDKETIALMSMPRYGLHTLIKKKIQFSSYIRKFRMHGAVAKLQSSSCMGKYVFAHLLIY
jgi:hypothetical protein